MSCSYEESPLRAGHKFSLNRLSASCSLDTAASGDQLKEQDDNGNDDEHVNETATDLEGEEPERPQDEQYNRDRIKHQILLLLLQIAYRPPGADIHRLFRSNPANQTITLALRGAVRFPLENSSSTWTGRQQL